jgi:hypothetical protein
MVMNTKYRKPIIGMKDRHILMKLDGDFTDYEIRHILRHAYLNHKAPHEYDDANKYIRDIVIGEHNSVYIMSNGVQQPLASVSIFNPDLLSTLTSGGYIYYDYALFGGCGLSIVYTNNATCTSVGINSPSGCTQYNGTGSGLYSYGYNNGNAVVWELLYTNTPFTSIPPNSSSPLLVGPYNPGTFTYAGIKYGYAAYQTSNNPLTLTTYYYWEAPSGSFSYAYFNLYASIVQAYTVGSLTYLNRGGNALIPIFYSKGNYSFNANTYYISVWQFTYT